MMIAQESLVFAVPDKSRVIAFPKKATWTQGKTRVFFYSTDGRYFDCFEGYLSGVIAEDDDFILGAFLNRRSVRWKRQGNIITIVDVFGNTVDDETVYEYCPSESYELEFGSERRLCIKWKEVNE